MVVVKTVVLMMVKKVAQSTGSGVKERSMAIWFLTVLNIIYVLMGQS